MELELADTATATARQDANSKEKERWTLELAKIVEVCGMPAAGLAARSMDPARALARLDLKHLARALARWM